MLDATDFYVKSENLYQPKFDHFFKDQTILSISGATPQYWYMYCVGPTMASQTGELKDYKPPRGGADILTLTKPPRGGAALRVEAGRAA